MIETENVRALQAVLFDVAFWLFDLEILSRGLHPGWLQRDAGIIFRCLSVPANDWQSPARLSRPCTIPINAVLDKEWDTATCAMEGQVLRALQWFGLLEHREEKTDIVNIAGRDFHRKSAMFDRFLSFDVRLEGAKAVRR